MTRCASVLLGLAVLAGGGGCFKPAAPTMHEESLGRVYMFPGIGCGAWCLHEAYRALRDGGVTAAIVIDEWDTPGYNALGHLQDYQRNQARAARVADEIAAYRRRQPAATIDLVGYSAGGGIAVLVAEALPEHMRLRNVVLVQSAVSPTHDLTTLLQRIDGRLVNLYAPHDVLILGWGTETFGNVDRTCEAAAGKVGFDLPRAVPKVALRAKIVQIPWTPAAFWDTGHLGGHGGLLGYAWNKAYVAPWLRP